MGIQCKTGALSVGFQHPARETPPGPKQGPQVPGVVMTICPVAIAVGCKKCPVFKVCPAKTTLGDYDPDAKPAAPKKTTDAGKRG